MAVVFDREGYARQLINGGVSEADAYAIADKLIENKTRGEPPLVAVKTSQVAAESAPGRRGRKNTDQLIEEALAIEAEAAADAGAIGYMARALVQATMPHKATPEVVFERRNGKFSLAMMAHPKMGLPYGSMPRLLVAWVTTEAVRTKSPELELGSSLATFMRELDLTPTGGRWGTITRLRDQMKRLFSSSVSCLYEDDHNDTVLNIQVVEEARLWWDPKSPEQAALWNSTIKLGRRFFEEAVNRPIPVDMRALKALKRSPMALDIYCWLTYRMSYLKQPVEIPWEGLQMQFGADYAVDSQGARNFKKGFLKHLLAVQVVYPDAQVREGKRGLILMPGRTHVPPPRSKPPLLPDKK